MLRLGKTKEHNHIYKFTDSLEDAEKYASNKRLVAPVKFDQNDIGEKYQNALDKSNPVDFINISSSSEEENRHEQSLPENEEADNGDGNGFEPNEQQSEHPADDGERESFEFVAIDANDNDDASIEAEFNLYDFDDLEKEEALYSSDDVRIKFASIFYSNTITYIYYSIRRMMVMSSNRNVPMEMLISLLKTMTFKVLLRVHLLKPKLNQTNNNQCVPIVEIIVQVQIEMRLFCHGCQNEHNSHEKEMYFLLW